MGADEDEAGSNRCVRCGACCGLFKISFPDSEADAGRGGTVPVELTVSDGAFKRSMKTVDKAHRRCIALEGSIGWHAVCTIYDRRPSTCRNFIAAWQGNVVNDQCNRARAVYGLTAFDAV